MKGFILTCVFAIACVGVSAAAVPPPQLVPPIPIPDLCLSATGCGVTFTNSNLLANFQKIQADIYKMQSLYQSLQQLQGMQFSSWASAVTGGGLAVQNSPDSGGQLGAAVFNEVGSDAGSLQSLENLAPSVQGPTAAADLNAGMTAQVAGALQQQMALQAAGAVTLKNAVTSTPAMMQGIFDLNEPADAGWQNV